MLAAGQGNKDDDQVDEVVSDRNARGKVDDELRVLGLVQGRRLTRRNIMRGKKQIPFARLKELTEES